LGNKISLSNTYNNIGVICQYRDDDTQALNFLKKALALRTEVGDKKLIANSVNNIAMYFAIKENSDAALEYFKKALKLYVEIDDKNGIALVFNNIGNQYYAFDTDSTKKYFNLSLQIYKELDDARGMATCFQNLAILNEDNYEIELQYLDSSLIEIKKINDYSLFSNLYLTYSNVYEYEGDTAKAFDNFKLYKLYEDSLFNIESEKKMKELQIIYDTEAKERQILEQKADIEKHKLLRNSLVIGITLTFLLVVIVYISYRIKKKDNKLLHVQNIKIANQRDEIEMQKQTVERINYEITDSIHYASRIQAAILPPSEILKKYFTDFFIFYQPRDIVSGDFYWWTEKDNKLFFAVADCTGHGVPGSMVSMLGMSLLNEIVAKYAVQTSSDILNKLRSLIISTFHQTGSDNETRDGMDISIGIFNKENSMLQFSAAYNSAYIFRNQTNELEELKADRMPIGIHVKKDIPFTFTETFVNEQDVIYLFSDGILDQFDSLNKNKFTRKRMKELLAEIQHLPMNLQKDTIQQKFLAWKGTTHQLDDVCVLGFKF